MAEPVTVSTTIDAAPEVVWPLVSDPTRMGEFSPENEGAEWLKGATAPAVGVTFRGANRHGSRTWSTHGRITEVTPNRTFEFVVRAGPFKVARWRYELEPAGDGCTVTETTVDLRGPVPKLLAKAATGVEDREAHNRATMAATLERVKAAAEATASGSTAS